MIGSSAAAPDLGDICRSVLGRTAVSFEPIGAGRNSRVFRVDLGGAVDPDGRVHLGGQHADSAPRTVVVKFYRCDPGDTRDRLSTEFGSLRFLWENGVRAVPRPIAVDRDQRCAIFEHIPGATALSAPLGPEDIDVSVDFLARLRDLRNAAEGAGIGPASEACFSIDEIVASVERRLDRLQSAPDHVDVEPMRGWIAGTLAPLIDRVREWGHATAARLGISFSEVIEPAARTLSPSDFGFHNAIRRPDGSLAFVDFEYFGWDDPAKTIVDFLLHPGMPLSVSLRRRFVVGVLREFAEIPTLEGRVRIVYPLFGLKWALILLNDFLPERFAQADTARRATQLQKAQSIVTRLSGEFADNPFLS